ncbi:transporter substrate-binding domain-containing protein [Microbispora sp. NEAU-D428]|uniref:serine/threonine-protein kinase n=1 Tax=Microbispora sitophila TaxID=2771537 RepID=UPI0018660FFD|nr:serine/threonine-protein kinase [Microbispora sitophila]MBE3008738.1 transporter substrate-binding domain-containing protein [Microbispora sitophila]
MGNGMPQIAPLQPGDPTRLGPFVLSGRLGEGGQGVVYFGQDQAGERAAVKLLHVKFSGDATARSRFARELRAAQRVASFCTARVLAADLQGDTPYIASEFIDGRSLREAVEADGPLTGSGLERLAVGTATALTAIHQAGIVHRDFKPDNVLLAVDGPRVVDFGIARILDSTATITSRAIGTPAYMAPEQISGGKVGPPADVFSWASTIAYAATGDVVFGGNSIAVVLNRILNHDIDTGMLPEPLGGVVRACLRKSPDERPTADQILLRLLGRAVSGDASAVVLSEGAAHAADPDATRLARTNPGRAMGPGRTVGQGRAISTGGGSLPTGGAWTGNGEPTRSGARTGTDGHAGNDVPTGASPALLSSSGPTAPRSGGASGGVPRGGAGHGGHGAARPGLAEPAPAGMGPDGTVSAGIGRARRRRRGLVGALAAVLALAAAGGAVIAAKTGFAFGGATEDGGTGDAVLSPRPSPTYASVYEKARRTKRLTIGVRWDVPGVGLEQASGFSGFDVDVATSIARSLNVPASGITFRRVGVNDRVRALTDRTVDMVVATYSYDDNRDDAVTFAGPYYRAHADLLVLAGSRIKKLDDLAGRRMCAPAGSTTARLVAGKVDVEQVPVSDYAECMSLLTRGEVDAVPGDDLIIAGFANRVASLKLSVLGLRLTDQRYAVGLPRKDVRTCRVVEDAISRMYGNGTMRDLLRKHFGNVDFDPERDAPPKLACR